MRSAFHRVCLASAIALATALASRAAAQEAPASEAGGLSEIVVTAQKRSENLQQTPLAVSAITSEMIEQRGIADVSSLTSIAPNLVVGMTGAATANVALFIRGIGESDTVLTADSPVGIYVDGVVLGRTSGAAFDLVDLERIEVLRGPQGTLYGRNTTGGAVNLISKKPGDTFSVEQSLSYGRFDFIQSKTTIDTGEWGDTGLRARATYLHKQRDGYVDNVLRSDSGDPGAYNTDAFRIAVRYDHGGPLRLDYAFDYNDRRGVSIPVQLIAARPDILAYIEASSSLGGEAPQISRKRMSTQRADTDGPVRDKITGHNFVAELDLSDSLTLRSLTGYRTWKNTVVSDQDGNGGLVGLVVDPGILAGGPFVPLGVQPISLFNLSFDRSQKQFTQEVNLLGNIGSSVDFVLGAYYFREVVHDANPTNFTLILPSGAPIEAAPGVFVNSFGVNLATDTVYRHKSRSRALFGQVTGHLTDRLSLTAGLRYTRDDKHLDQTVPFVRQLDRSFDKVNWAVSADYKVNDDIMAYARVATGYKAGGFSARAANDGFEPENLTSYEVGIKSELFDRRLRFNTAVFYTDLKDIQRSQFLAGSGGTISNVVNAGHARYIGVEAEAAAAVTDELTLTANFGYIDRKFLEFDLLDPATDELVDISDSARFFGSASTTLAASAEYRTPLSFGELTARLDYSYRTRVYYTTTALVNPYHEDISDGPVGLLDARLTLSDIEMAGGKLSIAGWVKNVTNEAHQQWGVDFGSLGFAYANYAEPRTWGIELKVSY
ncbi:TonB-dependent receptor [Croceicoccus estronivorus]|uniref:TonB-dependent receptor n=1 Tax=Croceicoccus estronivorus TaxID=1172626 RepID=UPI000830AB70|nr:TonB-dependent receptor [Croceicoccus estronivorus]OCC23460.1 TonB-dependent receptor [Croceicoccus estronivorus]